MLLPLFLPFYLMVFSANLVEAGRFWRSLVTGLVISFNLMLVLGGLTLLALGTEPLQMALPPEELARINTTAPALIAIVTAFLTTLLLAKRVRQAVIGALRLGLEPDNTVHTVALFFAGWLVGLTIAQLLLVMSMSVASLTDGSAITLGGIWEQGVAFVLFAILGVGLGLRRSARETLDRLGLTLPTGRQLGIAAGAVVLLTIWDFLVSLVWQMVDPTSFGRISEISELLFADMVGPLGALSIGLAAGIGEELLFRGALQPRFGLLAANLLFVVGHVQYELSPALFSVFVSGLVLGLLRRRESTTIAILVHAGYNIVNVLLASIAGG